MEEHWMWYLTGMVDSVGVFSGKIKKDDEFSIGYRFTPTLSISRNEKKEVVLGMVDEYCEDHGVIYRTENRTNGSSQIIIYQPESIKRFIEPIFSGLIQQQDEAEIMLDEILPMVEDGKHTTKRGMFEIAGHLDTLRESVFRGKKGKYTQGYFGHEWQEELF
ncbi:LAGLIDADG family homing endonuclease [Halorubrum lacusprofundi]|jgi:hypothetical protein|uniref:Homing endonuclease LAGLIDADG domain-containing protein n=1 Tax=Halorubrum lacusprofundi (strain ATCC 49239 / DSM 5036 / JCM 8891 / ACAM 34) TaxID=416348 RepID=B9LPD7_HALLT|nr:LAGLIDADG family homing endonuclease [Halorubrum lacusprofundi]ACM57225.1 hypothetical protein Hlac_1640 [Halorubrum lacusprofundi ATCC 49239]MCG1007250.1 hypothetical protein [Halorubrum lacusprofundi]